MHYYKFNISDWQSSTRHLTPEEEGVYFRLINYYYDTEKPIPLETQPVIRKLMLGSHSDTTNEILKEFFVKTEKGYEKEKCNELIKEYKKTANKNRKNGALGGRPRNNKAYKETQSVSSGNPDLTESKPKHNPNQEPLTKNQEPRTNINNQAKLDDVDKVIDRLNLKAGTKYKKSKASRDPIKARLNDFSVSDCYTVIDKKCKEWLGTDMAKYLRPSTLFKASKFESYLNQLETVSNETSRPKSLAERSEEQTRIILAQCEAEEANNSPLGSNGPALSASMDQCRGREAGEQPIDAEFYSLVQENGGLD